MNISFIQILILQSVLYFTFTFCWSSADWRLSLATVVSNCSSSSSSFPSTVPSSAIVSIHFPLTMCRIQSPFLFIVISKSVLFPCFCPVPPHYSICQSILFSFFSAQPNLKNLNSILLSLPQSLRFTSIRENIHSCVDLYDGLFSLPSTFHVEYSVKC